MVSYSRVERRGRTHLGLSKGSLRLEELLQVLERLLHVMD